MPFKFISGNYKPVANISVMERNLQLKNKKTNELRSTCGNIFCKVTISPSISNFCPVSKSFLNSFI